MRAQEVVMLGAPQIVGSLSSCSVAVQFNLLVPGATVRLQIAGGGAHLGQWTVANADQAFNLTGALTAGTNVEAVQFTASEPGLVSAQAYVNGHPTPADLSQGAFAKPLYECGECVWLYGLFAGAKVTVLSHNQEVLGSGIVGPDGQIKVALKRPLTTEDNLDATQTACGGITSATPIAGGVPLSTKGLTLPQTQVQAVQQCANALYFENGMNGARFTVNRTPMGGTTSVVGPFCLPVFPFTLWGFAPFQPGEALVISTNLLGTCKKAVGKKVMLTVSSGPPSAPVILNAICTDTKAIIVGGLDLNAVVEIAVNTPGNPVTLHFGANGPKLSFSFSTGQPGAPVLKAGTQISVRQNLCGFPNSWSPVATTIVHAAAPSVPQPVSPANHATGVALTPALGWNDTGAAPCSQASGYNVRVGTSAAMTTLVFAPSMEIFGASIAIPAGVLQPSVTYFWQVRAYHAGNAAASAWSAVIQFTTMKATPPPDQTFYFCKTCSGQSTTISVQAPDYATAEAKAQSQAKGCTLQPGKCPEQPANQTFYFCQTCPGFSGPTTITIVAPDYATASQKAQSQTPSTCFLTDGKCS